MPPVPGADRYELSQPSLFLEPPTKALAAMRQWEERSGDAAPTDTLLFDDRESAESVALPPHRRRKARMRAFYFAGVLILIAAITGWLRFARHAPPPVSPQLSLTARQREQLVELLPKTGFQGDQSNPRTSSETLQLLALRSERPIQKRCSELLAKLNQKANSVGDGELQGFLKDTRKEWDEPMISLADEPIADPVQPSTRIENSINLLQRYAEIRELLDAIVERDVAPSVTFRDHLKELETLLQTQ